MYEDEYDTNNVCKLAETFLAVNHKVRNIVTLKYVLDLIQELLEEGEIYEEEFSVYSRW